jgi:hypothetical protein
MESLGAKVPAWIVKFRSPQNLLTKFQCKRNNRSQTGWSAADLIGSPLRRQSPLGKQCRREVRVRFPRSPLVYFVISSYGRDRCDNKAEEFLEHSLSKKHWPEYETLCACWASSPRPMLNVRSNFCNGWTFESQPEVEDIHRIAEKIAEGDGRTIVTALGSHLE